MDEDPARLHVVFARDAPRAVVFRRGPSKQVRLILWHTDTDVFEPGQWLKGRIYEEKAALSPNGQLLAYFATDWRNEPENAYRRRRQSEFEIQSPTWNAISRPPYLTALALVPQGWGTHDGWTTWQDNQTVQIVMWDAIKRTFRTEPPTGFTIEALETRQSRNHLSARGWRRLSDPEDIPKALGELLNERKGFLPQPYEKPLRGSGVSLVQSRYGPEIEIFRLWNRQSGLSCALPAAFADVDPQGRLIVAEAGKLFRITVSEDLDTARTELADFNDMHFEPIAPPEWAKLWPKV